MNLVKWMRKNNKKIMAIVVIILMIAFVGGSALQYLLQPHGAVGDVIARYGRKAKITRYDLDVAGNELQILQSLQADTVLRQQDLRGVMLGELLFSQSRAEPALMGQVMQMIRRNQYNISDRQLMAMYERTVSPPVYWILLCDEAKSAGIRVPTADVGGLLGRIIPQLFGGQSYQAIMTGLVSRFRVSEQHILETFGRLLAVLQYAQTICSTEDVTIPQLTHMASTGGDTLSAEFVQLESKVFADKQTPPAPEAMQAQFDKYKDNFSGSVSQDNPFGFGYKLMDRVQFDYIALKLEDVARIVPAPTQEEAELFYRQNRQRLYTRQVPSDPNNPDSEKVPQVTSYAEVADTIMEQLRQQKITTKAEQILEEAKSQANTNLDVGAEETRKLSVEELKEKAEERTYGQIAQDLAAKHGITLYNGTTGWLNAVDVQMDKRLGRLYVSGQGTSPVRLNLVLFSVDALGEDAVPLMFAPSARMYFTLGPASDPMSRTNLDLAGQIMMVARIVGVSKAAEPENLDMRFSTRTLDLGEAAEPNDATYSVREKVTEDLQQLAAWDTTRSRAEELVALASQEGWDPAVAKFNDLYGKQAKKDPNDPNIFKLDTLNGLQRMSDAQLQVIAAQVASNPASATVLDEARVEQRFIDRLYSLVPADADSAPGMPQVLEFKPNQSAYALKSVSVKRLTLQQYEKMKGTMLQQEDYTQSQSLAVVHFNPANILKRMNFSLTQESSQATDKGDAAQQKSKDTAS
jgi:hypothetical protein